MKVKHRSVPRTSADFQSRKNSLLENFQIKKNKNGKIAMRPKDKDAAVTREGSGFSATQHCKLALRFFEVTQK